MPSQVCSAAVNGIDAYPVEVEVNEGYGDTVIVMLSCILPMPNGSSARHKPRILMVKR